MKLIRYTADIDWPHVHEMEKYLYTLVTADVSDETLAAAAGDVAAFQEEKGEFAFCRDSYMPGDAYAHLVSYATCLCTAVLIRAAVRIPGVLTDYRAHLALALKACERESFNGHGYDAQAHEERLIDLFRRAGCTELMKREPGLCPKFTALWHDVDGILLFVYGTLRRGERNHRYLKDCAFLCIGELQGYGNTDFHHLPGVEPGKGHRVVGEVYRVPIAVLPRIDRLEGEGMLYRRTPVTINALESFSCFPAQVYVPITDGTAK